MDLSSKRVAIVTGASSGIGKETALLLSKKGVSVVLASRNREKLEHTHADIATIGGRSLVIPTDVAKPDDCKNLIAETYKAFGRIDILINNAGYGHYASIEKLDPVDLDKIFRTNLYGALYCTREVLPVMKRQEEGHIVDVSTIISTRAVPYMSAYCMTKFALNAMNESLRLEVKKYGIDVTLICPGLTATGFQTNAGSIDFKPYKSNKNGMKPVRVAEGIVKAIEKRKRRVFFTIEGKALHWLNKISPALVDEVIFRRFETKKP